MIGIDVFEIDQFFIILRLPVQAALLRSMRSYWLLIVARVHDPYLHSVKLFCCWGFFVPRSQQRLLTGQKQSFGLCLL